MTEENGCLLCQPINYPLIWRNDDFRVVLIDDQAYPGYCRVEVIKHIKEMTDLSELKQQSLLKIVLQVEKALRAHLNPEKINLACLGNITPHLHWHIIPRYKDDNHFPASIWSIQKRFKKDELSEPQSQTLIKLIQEALDG